jgi:hypothetical protein
MRAAPMLACVLLAAGCSDDPAELPDVLLPTISSLGGPVIAHPQLVPMFYSDDPDAEPLTRFSQWVVTSSWLDQVGAEYGVGSGSVLGVVHRADAAPDRITDAEIVDLLFQGVADGTLPKPPDGNLGEVIYIANFPVHTKVTFGGSDSSCIDFGGYHLSARRNGVELVYAVIVTCPGFFQGLSTLEGRQIATSHELIEAATDPIATNRPAYQLVDPLGSWSGLGTEVADLCVRSDETAVWREGGFAAQRSWSNAAIASGDPCVPVSSGAPYFNVVVDGTGLPRIPPGGHESRTLIGFSTGSTSDWQLSAQAAKTGNPTVKLADNRLNAGKSTTLDISVPSTIPRGTRLQLFVYSAVSATSYHLLPMLAIVDVACSTFPTCESCSAHIGCGFCATTGRCETEGVSGSAESACPPSSFATWPGSCGSFCATRNNSCAECSSLAGCGWCNSGDAMHCLEASHEQGHPASATCADADWSFTPDYCPR